MPDRILASNINGWYETLNNIRTKHGMSTYTLPTATAGTTKILSADVVALRSKIYDTYNNEIHLRQILADIAKPPILEGAITAQSSRDNISNTLNELYNICHVDPCVVNNVNSNTTPCSNSSNPCGYNVNSGTNGVYSNYSNDTNSTSQNVYSVGGPCGNQSISGYSNHQQTNTDVVNSTWTRNSYSGTCGTATYANNNNCSTVSYSYSQNSNCSAGGCNTNTIYSQYSTACTQGTTNSTNTNYGRCTTYSVHANTLQE